MNGGLGRQIRVSSGLIISWEAPVQSVDRNRSVLTCYPGPSIFVISPLGLGVQKKCKQLLCGIREIVLNTGFTDGTKP